MDTKVLILLPMEINWWPGSLPRYVTGKTATYHSQHFFPPIPTPAQACAPVDGGGGKLLHICGGESEPHIALGPRKVLIFLQLGNLGT